MAGKSIKTKAKKKKKINLRKLETTSSSTLSIPNLVLASDGYFMPDVDINSMLVLPKPPI